MKMIRNFSAVLLGMILVSCGGGFRNGHAPGEIENLENATVYHLADGVFIHERHNGSKHYHLVEATVAGYDLKPAGLEVEFDGEFKGTLIAERQPDNYVTAFMTLVPGDGIEGTRFGVDPSIIEKITTGFDAAMTVDDIYRLKK